MNEFSKPRYRAANLHPEELADLRGEAARRLTAGRIARAAIPPLVIAAKRAIGVGTAIWFGAQAYLTVHYVRDNAAPVQHVAERAAFVEAR